MKPCPFCGKRMDETDVDTVYPSGFGWIDHWEENYDYREYVSVLSVPLPKEQWCYQVVCQTHQGGCGAQISGDSKIEAIENWNRRYE